MFDIFISFCLCLQNLIDIRILNYTVMIHTFFNQLRYFQKSDGMIQEHSHRFLVGRIEHGWHAASQLCRLQPQIQPGKGIPVRPLKGYLP